MSSPTSPTSSTQVATALPLDTQGRITYFSLQGLGSLAASYYFNYFFFYLEQHYGFKNRENLLLAAFYGLLYTVAAWYAGRFITRFGASIALKTGFCGMGLAMLLGALAPVFFGHGKLTLIIQLALVVLWTITMCQTWPTLQALLSRGQNQRELSRTAGLYNMAWSGTSALAYLTSGALLDFFGGEILFWVAFGLHLTQLVWLLFEENRVGIRVQNSAINRNGSAADVRDEIPHESVVINKPFNFLYLAWVANPFAYVAIFGLIPVIPGLAARFHLSATMAGFVCSIWQWVRLGSFALFWLWPGWHYKFRWLLASFMAMAASYLAILSSTQLWMLVAAQVVFGLAIGLIYYSSLFYTMDLGVSKGKGGGIHEAAIGVGVFAGPSCGVAALMLFPQFQNASTYGITGMIVLGLFIFAWVRYKRISPAA